MKLESLARSKWAPWIIFFIAVATRTGGAMMGGSHSDDQDGTAINMALNYLSGHGLSLVTEYGRVYSWLPPGMGMLDVLFVSLFGRSTAPVRIIFVLMSAAAAVALFYVGKRLYEEKFAWLAALWWAIYPPQWFWASRMNPQTYATNVLVFCLLLLYLGWEKQNFLAAFLIGILWVTITLCRGEYALGIFVLALVSLGAFPARRDGFLFGSLLILGWVAAFTPWVVRNYQIHHRFVLIAANYGDSFWKAYNPAYNFSGFDIPFPPELQAKLAQEPTEVGRADILKNEGFRFIQENPGRALRNVAGNLLHFWRPWLSPQAVSLKQNILYVVSYVPLFILFVLALFKIPWRDPHWSALGGILLYKWLIHGPFYIIVRYREAVMPLIALIAVFALRDLWSKQLEKSHA